MLTRLGIRCSRTGPSGVGVPRRPGEAKSLGDITALPPQDPDRSPPPTSGPGFRAQSAHTQDTPPGCHKTPEPCSDTFRAERVAFKGRITITREPFFSN